MKTRRGPSTNGPTFSRLSRQKEHFRERFVDFRSYLEKGQMVIAGLLRSMGGAWGHCSRSAGAFYGIMRVPRYDAELALRLFTDGWLSIVDGAPSRLIFFMVGG
jgi:hypothetical protein